MNEGYRVLVGAEARDMLRRISRQLGKKTANLLQSLIASVVNEPARHGNPLRPPLGRFHVLHHAQYRIVYRIDENQRLVLIVAVGVHTATESVYETLQGMIDAGVLEIPNEPPPS